MDAPATLLATSQQREYRLSPPPSRHPPGPSDAAARDLHAIDELALLSDHVVDRASDRAGARCARSHPQIAVGVPAGSALSEDGAIVGQLVCADERHLRSTAGFAR